MVEKMISLASFDVRLAHAGTSIVFSRLTILTGRTCVLLKKFIEERGWLLVTFFICLHNQLSSYRCLENVVHQVESKNEWCTSYSNFYSKT